MYTQTVGAAGAQALICCVFPRTFFSLALITDVARSFRMFGKKRGHRRTGSKTLRNVGEVVFFALLLTMGTAFLVLLLARKVIPEWRANHEFLETTATILEKRIEHRHDPDGNLLYVPKAKIQYDQSPDDIWTYDIASTSTSHEADAQSLLDRYEIGQAYACWYDPLDPSVAVLVRGYSLWFWMLLLAPSGFMLIGGGGLAYTLWHWGRSPEHQAARGQLGRIDLFEEQSARAKDYPTVPFDADLTNSPGTQLKYRLPSSASQGWRLLAATTICLIWNGIVAVFVVLAVRKHLQGAGDWPLDLLVLPFFLVGCFLIYYFVREILIATGVGPTIVEISAHPLLPGVAYELYVAQQGHLSVKTFEVLLRCEEQATFHQGTDTRTDRREVYTQQLLQKQNFEIVPGEPFEIVAEFRVPPGAMHSFEADHNQVQWKLIARGEAEGWPAFERSYAVVVYPPERSNGAQADEPAAGVGHEVGAPRG
ncbi:MAG TPA: DUF3592 domain-containing protein [Pirellulales bacterium]|nr:DUF3592 domain-containing protein [Pirellulales bacterium]